MQQTLHMEVSKISPCTKGEGDAEEYVQTDFDALVDDFVASITEPDPETKQPKHMVRSRVYYTAGERVCCTVVYSTFGEVRDEMRQQMGGLVLPSV